MPAMPTVPSESCDNLCFVLLAYNLSFTQNGCFDFGKFCFYEIYSQRRRVDSFINVKLQQLESCCFEPRVNKLSKVCWIDFSNGSSLRVVKYIKPQG